MKNNELTKWVLTKRYADTPWFERPESVATIYNTLSEAIEARDIAVKEVIGSLDAGDYYDGDNGLTMIVTDYEEDYFYTSIMAVSNL